MAFIISTRNNEKTFANKQLVNISSKDGYDFKVDVDFNFILAVQYDENTNRCFLLNQFHSDRFLFKGKPIPAQMEINKVCKIMIANSEETITIKVLGETSDREIAEEAMTEDDVIALYGTGVNAAAKLKIEKRKSELESVRVGIIKEFWQEMNDLKHKISMNSKGGIVMHIGLFLASFVCAFGVSNYLTGLPLSDAGSVIQMPTNMKLIFIYTLVIYGVGLVLKQGVYLFLQNKLGEDTIATRISERFMIVLSTLFYSITYLINVLYYMTPKSFPFFAIFVSLFFIVTTVTLAMGCGYMKNNSVELRKELNRIEYRPDFERVIKEYQRWIERYANNLSENKIRSIKDKSFMLQLKSVGEIFLGILTAPFLAYGVSNTLAMCFPEAAGWIRISGLRFSPIFLVLATFLIIFAFFSFVNTFFTSKKIQASNVIKQDGFSNYVQHGVEIYGLEGVRRLDAEMRRSMIIALAIVCIEFSMNVSYFMQEIGADLSGMLLAAVAALVPTALLVAETFMLSQTKFEIFACNELIEKVDRE